MAVLGIVAEFNPFHNGHRLLLEQASHAGPFDAVICVMSGSFLQRGEPAICHKWARAEMALKCGADLVMELPFCFAARSAYFFARGALQLLQRTGVVTHLAFGCETPRWDTLESIASLLASEPREYRERLKHYLDQGLNFALARSRSLNEFAAHRIGPVDDILAAPNNILALEYLRVIKEERLPFTPVPVVRQGSSYHDTDLHPLASATAIRRLLLEEHNPGRLKEAMPPSSFAVLRKQITEGKAPVRFESLGPPLLIKLRTMSCRELEDIYEISEGLENRIIEAANHSGSLRELTASVKSRRYSLTRIQRTLIYILFSLTRDQVEEFDQHGPLYLHVLGFSSKGRKILQDMKNKSTLPILSRGSEVKRWREKSRDKVLKDMLALDCMSTDIHALLFPEPSARHGSLDYTTSPVMV